MSKKTTPPTESPPTADAAPAGVPGDVVTRAMFEELKSDAHDLIARFEAKRRDELRGLLDVLANPVALKFEPSPDLKKAMAAVDAVRARLEGLRVAHAKVAGEIAAAKANVAQFDAIDLQTLTDALAERNERRRLKQLEAEIAPAWRAVEACQTELLEAEDKVARTKSTDLVAQLLADRAAVGLFASRIARIVQARLNAHAAIVEEELQARLAISAVDPIARSGTVPTRYETDFSLAAKDGGPRGENSLLALGEGLRRYEINEGFSSANGHSAEIRAALHRATLETEERLQADAGRPRVHFGNVGAGLIAETKSEAQRPVDYDPYAN